MQLAVECRLLVGLSVCLSVCLSAWLVVPNVKRSDCVVDLDSFLFHSFKTESSTIADIADNNYIFLFTLT